MTTENGMVIGAEAAYDAKMCKEDELRIAVENKRDELRDQFEVAEFIEVITEGSGDKLNGLREAWRQGDHAEAGAILSDLVDDYINGMARSIVYGEQ